LDTKKTSHQTTNACIKN